MTDMSKKEIKDYNEIELYMVIDGLGGFIWQLEHDMSHERIPKDKWVAIDEDIVKMRKTQKEAVAELPKFNVNPYTQDNKVSDEYWVWFRTWDKWKKEMSDERLKEVDNSICRGTTEEEVAKYKAEAFGIINS